VFYYLVLADVKTHAKFRLVKRLIKQGHSKNNIMKNEKNKTKSRAAKKVNHDQSGMSQFIRTLFAAGVKKDEAYSRTLEKFPIAKARKTHFEPRWKAAQRRVENNRTTATLAKKVAAKAAAPVAA
jgi:hypothetical protein